MFPWLHGRRWWHFRRFEGLLLSLACMFLLNIIFPGKIYGGTAQACYLPLQPGSICTAVFVRASGRRS